jgi:4-hydroxybenzoate polyprenyltransferase
MSSRLSDYLALIRFDKPIGTLLVLWPTLWGLWMASSGEPKASHLIIFILGCFLMRSAGCAINDYADRDFDKHVSRTQDRPITAGRIKPTEALIIAAVLAFMAFILILPLNTFTKLLSVPALAIAMIYPFTKRFFSIPQAILGIAFSFGIPMAFAAVLNEIPSYAWLLVLANIAWAIAYDTAYAMVDRDDDLRLGIKTSAITFGQYDVLAICICYGFCLLSFAVIGWLLILPVIFWIFLGLAFLLAIYYFQLIKGRQKEKCFLAFRRNNWFGMCLFLAIAFTYY